MPLKLVQPFAHRPQGSGHSSYWYVRGSYLGIRVNRSTGVSSRKVAGQVLKKIERDIESGTFSQRGEPTFASAAAAYMKAGGERTYLRRLLEHFGETPLSQIDQAAIDGAALSLYPQGTAATRNRSVYTPTSAVLRAAGIHAALRRPKGSSGNRATAWLWPEQAFRLIEEAQKLNPEFAALLTVLLYTGMRLSEALGLTWNDIRLQDGFAYVPDTKNGEPRAVFLPPVAVAALANVVHDNSRVFRFAKGGHIYSLLRVASIRASVELPERSAFHILRHSYATWARRFTGADEKALMSTGAWKDRKSVDRYTHTVVSEDAQRIGMGLPVPGKRAG